MNEDKYLLHNLYESQINGNKEFVEAIANAYSEEEIIKMLEALRSIAMDLNIKESIFIEFNNVQLLDFFNE